MLSYVRKYAYSWQMKVVYLLIAITFFGGFGILSTIRRCGGISDPNIVARVNNDKISLSEFLRAYEAQIQIYREMAGDEVDEDLLQSPELKNEILNGLIRRILILQEAKRLKLKATDEEVRSIIAGYPAFQDESKRFDLNRYRRVLSANRLTPSDFEEIKRNEIIMAKFEDLIAGSVVFTPEEVEREYRIRNEKVNLKFIEFNPEDYRKDGESSLEPAKNRARTDAEGTLNRMKAGRSSNRKADETGLFSITGDYIPKIGFSEEIIKEAFSLTKKSPFGSRVFESDGKYYIIWLKERRTPTKRDFEEEREDFEKELLRETRLRVIGSWLRSALGMSKVKINQQALDSIGRR